MGLPIFFCKISVNDCDYSKTNPNHFTTPEGGILFKICFTDPAGPIEPIVTDATGNFWIDENGNNDQPSANGFSNIALRKVSDGNCDMNTNTQPLNDSQPATALSENCENTVIVKIPGEAKTDCFTDEGSTTCLYSDGTNNNLEMNYQYNQALTDFVSEDYVQSASKFSELANISDAQKDTYCAPCQHYINVARSRTFYNLGSDGSEGLIAQNSNASAMISTAEKRKEEHTELAFKVEIFPNPTNGLLNIKTGSAMTNVRIMDVRGQVLFSKTEGGDFQINMEAWSSGVYVVEIFEPSSGEMIRRKVVKQP